MTDTKTLTELVEEAGRVMGICNACRYCEGYCAVFPAMERRMDFARGDLLYLSQLCHDCRGCYYACQYAPPHEFAVNVPKVFGELRREGYRRYAWPGFLGAMYRDNGTKLVLVTVLSLVLVLVLGVLLIEPGVLFAAHSGPGAFYRVVPHAVMAWPAGLVFVFSVLAIGIGVRRYWREIDGGGTAGGGGMRVGHDVATMRNLGGGGQGCDFPGEAPSHARRWLHQCVLYGFLLAFASTATGTVYHYVFGWEAPYAWLSLPVVLGTLGGLGMCVGTLGLLWQRREADPAPQAEGDGMDRGFTLLLFLTSLTGLLLLALRDTPLMGILLLVHLGVVLGLFLLLPYSKFVHGFYRVAALLKNAREAA